MNAPSKSLQERVDELHGRVLDLEAEIRDMNSRQRRVAPPAGTFNPIMREPDPNSRWGQPVQDIPADRWSQMPPANYVGPHPITLPWRVGRKLGRTIYQMVGDQPSDDDVCIGMMDTAELARWVVNAVNHGWRPAR